MDLNSPIFDRIRVKSSRKSAAAPTPVPSATLCSHPGCAAEGIFKAPKGRDHEGEYFSFCKDHVREYNATYDYFRGMDDDALAKYRQAEAIGHRPTWKMGPRGGAHGEPHVDETVYAEARSMRRRGARRTGDAAQAPRYNALALKALFTLELDANATVTTIKARYKALVKRHHPDANGGDRSSEDKLREIIQAYNFLRANKLV
jgi:DnaJ domain